MEQKNKKEVVTCLWHNQKVVSPCQLSSCDLWHNTYPQNCQLTLTMSTVKDSVSQLAKWRGWDAQTVQAKLKQALTMLRNHLVATNLITRCWYRTPHPKTCAVCGRRKARIFVGGWSWCSEICYNWLDEKKLDMEARFGVPFRTLLINPKLRSLLPAASDVELQELCWQYAGVPYEGRHVWKPNATLPSKERLRQRLRRSNK